MLQIIIAANNIRNFWILTISLCSLCHNSSWMFTITLDQRFQSSRPK